MTSETLKPCPFCGRKANFWDDEHSLTRGCIDEDCAGNHTMPISVEAWHRRPSPPPAEGETPDALAAEIRRVDGGHSLGAAALAEALMPFVCRLRASQPVAEGVVAWMEPTTGNTIFTADRERLEAENGNDWKEVFINYTYPVYAPTAPAPEGGTLPPGCPEKGMWGQEWHGDPELKWFGLHAECKGCKESGCIPVEIHPLGTRSSLRAADLGRGAVDFHPDRLPPMDAKGYFWHPDLNIIAPDESVTWASAKLAARAAGFELTVVEYMEWVPDNEMADVHDWPREKPEGEGWRLIAKADSEDGPIAVWVRAALPSAPQLKGGEAP